MHAQRVAGLEVVHHDLAVQLHPRVALAGQPLHAKAGASEDACAESLLKTDRELHAGRRAHEAMAVNHVSVARRDLQREDLPGKLGREREQARPADRCVLGHEQRAAGDRSAERAEEAALLAARRRGRLHLDGHRHPRQLAGLCEHLLVRLHVHLEDGHHRADDLRIHRPNPPKAMSRRVNGLRTPI